ncbi:hypothetical protein JR316_0011039 [Psilocybe cubensis]|uniref:DUF6533 domain-containing protein n=2 Tax=Psilocybe cubensis TaxID=181762 RepID=A0A8H7XPV2_PSICU|nr:hypothetical protein JR316_0011039 [Psilocybe cubensis]KAH9477123.1 hypothetical protein JR316_0011039 [Psilocybe cubensis]
MNADTFRYMGDAVKNARYVRLDLGIWIISQSLLLYDYLCTLKSEVEFVWPCPWSMGVLLFYLNRYLPLVNFVLVIEIYPYAGQVVRICGSRWLTTGSLLASQIIIVLRTYAVWGRRRLIFYILILWILVFPGTMVVLGGIVTHDILKRASELPANLTQKMTCSTNFQNAYVGILIFYIMIFSGEFVIVVLTVIKAKQHMRIPSPSWVRGLYKNGILQCACMMGFSLLNSVIMFKGTAGIKMSIVPIQCNLHSVFCNRVIFLLLKHRRSQMHGPAIEDRHRQSGTLYIFTTVHEDVDDTFHLQPEEEEFRWQARAEREWIR